MLACHGCMLDSDDLLTRTYLAKWALYMALGQLLDPPVEVTPEMLRMVWGKPIPVIMSTLYGDHRDPAVLTEIRASIEGNYPVTAMPDASPFLAALRSVGMPLGILSSSATQYLRPALHQAGIPGLDKFIAIQGGEATTVHKPDPGVFKPILDAFAARGVTRPITYIGDHLNDWLAARGAGLDFVGVTSGLTTAEEFQDHGAPIVVPRLLMALPHLLADR